MLKGYNSYWVIVKVNGESKWLRAMGFSCVKRGMWMRFTGCRKRTQQYIRAIKNRGIVDGTVISDSQFGGYIPKDGVVVAATKDFGSTHKWFATKTQVAKGLNYFE